MFPTGIGTAPMVGHLVICRSSGVPPLLNLTVVARCKELPFTMGSL